MNFNIILKTAQLRALVSKRLFTSFINVKNILFSANQRCLLQQSLIIYFSLPRVYVKICMKVSLYHFKWHNSFIYFFFFNENLA